MKEREEVGEREEGCCGGERNLLGVLGDELETLAFDKAAFLCSLVLGIAGFFGLADLCHELVRRAAQSVRQLLHLAAAVSLRG